MTIAATSLPPATSQLVVTAAAGTAAAAPDAGFGEAVDTALAPLVATAPIPTAAQPAASASPTLMAGATIATVAMVPGKLPTASLQPGMTSPAPAEPTPDGAELPATSADIAPAPPPLDILQAQTATLPVPDEAPASQPAVTQTAPLPTPAKESGKASAPQPTVTQTTETAAPPVAASVQIAAAAASGDVASVAVGPDDKPTDKVAKGGAEAKDGTEDTAAPDSSAPVPLPVGAAQPIMIPAAVTVLASSPTAVPANAANAKDVKAASTAATTAGPAVAAPSAKGEREESADPAASSPAPSFAERLAAQAPAAPSAPRQDTGVPSANASLLAAGQPTATHPAAAPAPLPPVAAPHQPTVSAQAGQIGREMGVQIARRVTDGGSELTVRLNPAEMGRIEVKMSFDDSGTLRATVAAESPRALDLLRRDSADLGRAMTDAGVRADAQSFRFDSRAGGGDQFGQPQNRQQGGSQQTGAGRFYADDVGADQPIYRALRTSGRVDLMA